MRTIKIIYFYLFIINLLNFILIKLFINLITLYFYMNFFSINFAYINVNNKKIIYNKILYLILLIKNNNSNFQNYFF